MTNKNEKGIFEIVSEARDSCISPREADENNPLERFDMMTTKRLRDMMKGGVSMSYESYVAISPNNHYYCVEVSCIREGELHEILETDELHYAKQFDTIQDILDYEKSVITENYPFFEGQFIPKRIIKIKVEISELNEVYIF